MTTVTPNTTLNFSFPGVASGSGYNKLSHDLSLTNGSNNGVKFCHDLGMPVCYPGGPLAGRPAPVNPTSGQVIYDVVGPFAGGGTNGSAVTGGGTPTFSNGGFDLTPLTTYGSYVEGPASALADIWGAGTGATATATNSGGTSTPTVTAGGSGYVQGEAMAVYSGGGLSTAVAVVCTVTAGAISAIPSITGTTSNPTVTIVPSPQYGLIVGYFRMPASGDYMADTGIFASMAGGHLSAGIGSVADFLTFGQNYVSGVKQLVGYRQTVIGTQETYSIPVPSSAFGNLVQIAFWHNASGSTLRIKTATELASASNSSVLPNRSNFSAGTPWWGVPNCDWGSTFPSTQATAHKFKVYRGWIENLLTSGRNPNTVCDEDWTTQQIAIAASAAANGGTSAIFN